MPGQKVIKTALSPHSLTRPICATASGKGIGRRSGSSSDSLRSASARPWVFAYVDEACTYVSRKAPEVTGRNQNQVKKGNLRLSTVTALDFTRGGSDESDHEGLCGVEQYGHGVGIPILRRYPMRFSMMLPMRSAVALLFGLVVTVPLQVALAAPIQGPKGQACKSTGTTTVEGKEEGTNRKMKCTADYCKYG